MRLKFSYIFIILFSGLVLGGCATQEPPEKMPLASSNNIVKNKLNASYSKWKGVKYRYGGTTKRGIDCSSLVQQIYQNQFSVKLPRTTLNQVTQGVKVSKVKIGDLIFFKTGRNDHHVGIYVGNNQFLHASTSTGVRISKLSNPYWKPRIWQARRILNLEHINNANNLLDNQAKLAKNSTQNKIETKSIVIKTKSDVITKPVVKKAIAKTTKPKTKIIANKTIHPVATSKTAKKNTKPKVKATQDTKSKTNVAKIQNTGAPKSNADLAQVHKNNETAML